MKDRKLIIGYGNPLRGDDGVGWEVASRLAAAIPGEAVHILVVHQLTPELAEPVSEADMVIFIDASEGGEPGMWRCEAAKPGSASGPLGHRFDVPELLAYSQAVFKVCPRALVVSVAPESFDFRDHLAPCVEAALPELIECIRKIVSGAVFEVSTPGRYYSMDLGAFREVVSKVRIAAGKCARIEALRRRCPRVTARFAIPNK